MVARDRLIAINGKFHFGDGLYSGAAFTAVDDKNFSAVIMEAGEMKGIHHSKWG